MIKNTYTIFTWVNTHKLQIKICFKFKKILILYSYTHCLGLLGLERIFLFLNTYVIFILRRIKIIYDTYDCLLVYLC